MIFESDSDLKIFIKELITILNVSGEEIYALKLKFWDEESFSTSSEFLGELKLILVQINAIEILDSITKKNIKECIAVINQAFDNS